MSGAAFEAEYKWLFSGEITLSDHQLITNQSGLNDPLDLWAKFERLSYNKRASRRTLLWLLTSVQVKC